MRNLLSTLTAFAVSAFIVDAAYAQATSTWNGSVSSNWATAGNWTPSGGGGAPPASSDQIIIPDQSTTNNDPTVGVSGTYAALRVQAGGYIQINSGNSLTITNSAGFDLDPASGGAAEALFEVGSSGVSGGTLVLSGGGSDPIDGELRLSHSASVFSITSSSATVSGAGHVNGTNAAAEIRVAANTSGSPITLTNSAVIEGMLKIRGMQPSAGQEQGRFLNGATGVVRANAAGVLEFKEGDFRDAASGAKYVVNSNASAVLRFSVAPAATLLGDFMIAAGTLDIDDSVSTSGGMCFTSGLIDVAASKSFSATGAPASCP
jgi:hypothetical protein